MLTDFEKWLLFDRNRSDITELQEFKVHKNEEKMDTFLPKMYMSRG